LSAVALPVLALSTAASSTVALSAVGLFIDTLADDLPPLVPASALA
jgi:hypothetical protein